MSDAYPHLIDRSTTICKVIENEERSFHVTLTKGLQYIETLMARNDISRLLNGADVFKLYDTYGIPVDLTEVQGIPIDEYFLVS